MLKVLELGFDPVHIVLDLKDLPRHVSHGPLLSIHVVVLPLVDVFLCFLKLFLDLIQLSGPLVPKAGVCVL